MMNHRHVHSMIAVVLVLCASRAGAQEVIRGAVEELRGNTAVVKVAESERPEPGDFAVFPIADAEVYGLFATGVVTEVAPGRANVQFHTTVEGSSLAVGMPVEILRAGHGDEPPSTELPAGMILIAPHLVVAKGSQVLVPVRLLRANDVLNMDFNLAYQPEIASAHRIAERGALVTQISEYNLVQPGHYRFNFAQLSPINGDGSVAGFRFDAIGPGRSKTPLTLEVHTVNSSQGARLPISTVQGSITIYDPTDLEDPHNPRSPRAPGNANGTKLQPTCSGSGRQTVNDAQCCLKMWVGLTPRGLHMDVDGNGEVDSRDAVIVLQNVATNLSE